MSGWIKLHRSTQESAIASHPEYLAVWVHLLMRAQYSDSECVIGRSVLRLNPGQLVFGRIKFASQVGISEAKVRAALDVMKSLNMITIKSMAKFSIISITNWKKYQEDNQQIAAESPASNQQSTSNAPASNHIQESKELQEGKESKELNTIIPKNKFSDDDYKCAEWLSDKLREFIPDCKEPNLKGWAKSVRDMRELDNRDHKEICRLWLWCRKDGFEAANVQSPEKLRKRYDQLKTKMNTPATGGNYAGQPKPSLIDRFIQNNYAAGSGTENDYGSMGGDDSVIRGEVVEPVRGDAGRNGAMATDLIGDFKATGCGSIE